MKGHIRTIKDIEGDKKNNKNYEVYTSYFSGDSLEVLPVQKFRRKITFADKEITQLNYELAFKKVVPNLLDEIEKMKERIEILEKINANADKNILVAPDNLKNIWDNEEDDVWAKL